MASDAQAEAETSVRALAEALTLAEDPGTRARLAGEILDQLPQVIEQLPQRPKGWRALTAALKALGDPEAKAEIWRRCLALWRALPDDAADAFAEELAKRLFQSLASMVELLAPPNPTGIEAAWRLVRVLYADRAFGELAQRRPAEFAEFVRVSNFDRYLQTAGHGADISPCVADALELFAPGPAGDALLAVCRAQTAALHGGLPQVAALARSLLAEPEFLRPVIICGFHHSGTRLLARQLASLGVLQRINQFQYEWTYVIQLNSILEPGCMDPAGLGRGGEDARIISPERLAFRMGLAGLGPGKPWGFKDPRNGLTARTWLQVFPRARIINLLRDPVATLGTIPEVYDQFVRTDARRPTRTRFWIDLWEAYVQGARGAMEMADASVEIRFEDLCADPVGVLSGVQTALGLERTVTSEPLGDIPIESGKTDMRARLRAEGNIPAPEMAELEALGARYGYP